MVRISTGQVHQFGKLFTTCFNQQQVAQQWSRSMSTLPQSFNSRWRQTGELMIGGETPLSIGVGGEADLLFSAELPSFQIQSSGSMDVRQMLFRMMSKNMGFSTILSAHLGMISMQCMLSTADSRKSLWERSYSMLGY
eukprot:TRINITY_DN1567_c0_g3_i1.p1 TRINITY_DN1567_c0_g3~~TRINITY_DN1567_c0_g3_i1.p1  ORF type:complete len:138 (-),score=2.58 TRINITY_DN1567_c0_g3_i1:498-911(-)